MLGENLFSLSTKLQPRLASSIDIKKLSLFSSKAPDLQLVTSPSIFSFLTKFNRYISQNNASNSAESLDLLRDTLSCNGSNVGLVERLVSSYNPKTEKQFIFYFFHVYVRLEDFINIMIRYL